MSNFLALLRFKQYVKNFFIFLPLFFAGQATDFKLISELVLAFFAFSFSASSIYILNDYRDIDEDRQHPKKKNRPLASGAITIKTAFTVMVILIAISVIIMGSLSYYGLCIMLVYFVLNLFYIFHLKQIAVIDVCIIACGFVLRLYIGAVVVNIPLSMWIVVMTFLLALFIALAKRRDDVLIFLNTQKKMRKSIEGYNLRFIDSAMVIMASVVIVAYLLYATSTEVIEKFNSNHLYLTTLFVVVGIMRYLQVIYVEKRSGAPTEIAIKDRFMLFNITAWLLAFGWIIYW